MTEEQQKKYVDHLNQYLRHQLLGRATWIKDLFADERSLRHIARWIDVAFDLHWSVYAELLRYVLKEHPREGQLELPSNFESLEYYDLEKLFDSNPEESERIAEESLEYVPEHSIGRLDFLKQEIVEVFSESLPFPAPVRPHELWPVFRDWLIFESPHTLSEMGMLRLLNDLGELTRRRRYRFSIYEVERTFKLTSSLPLAENGEQTLRLIAVRHVLDLTGSSVGRRNARLMAELQGEFSERALKQAVKSLRKLLGNLLSVVSDVAWPSGKPQPARRTPLLRKQDWENESEFLIEMCRRPFTKLPTGKDSMESRFDSAIRFVRLAFESKTPAVGLLLLCSSIEALVGQKGEGLSATIAENVSTILEPDPAFRADAVAFIKKLYDIRSRVTHGSSKPVTLSELRTMRLVAVVLLHSVFSHRSTLRRLREKEMSIEEFLQQLRRAKYMPGQPLGVMEHAITSLWRKPASPV